jgi:hypothetical protein
MYNSLLCISLEVGKQEMHAETILETYFEATILNTDKYIILLQRWHALDPVEV